MQPMECFQYTLNGMIEVIDLFGTNSVLSIEGLTGELIEPKNVVELRCLGGQSTRTDHFSSAVQSKVQV
jgi:hypothetical protein